MIMGYIYPGRPLATVAFQKYGTVSMFQALGFLEDFKLGHYMKIPPKSMFLAQVKYTLYACIFFLPSSFAQTSRRCKPCS